jgi:uncharacterized protein YggE
LSFSSTKYNAKKAEELLVLAVADAKKQAIVISKVLGLKLGKILKISIVEDSSGEDFFGFEEGDTDKSKPLKNSFLKENIYFEKNINITYELKE